MPDTTAHGLPYPVGTDRVMDGDNAIRALAEALDPAAATTPLAAAAGWTVQTSSCWKLGPLCVVAVTATRTGAAITAPAGGNIGDVTVCGPVPADMIPADRVYALTVQSAGANGGGRVAGVTGGAFAGLLTIATLYPGSTIAVGDAVDLYAVYMLSGPAALARPAPDDEADEAAPRGT